MSSTPTTALAEAEKRTVKITSTNGDPVIYDGNPAALPGARYEIDKCLERLGVFELLVKHNSVRFYPWQSHTSPVQAKRPSANAVCLRDGRSKTTGRTYIKDVSESRVPTPTAIVMHKMAIARSHDLTPDGR